MDDSEKQSSKFLETYTDFVRERIVWEESKLPEYQTLVAEALEDASEYWDTSATIPHLCSLFSKLIVQSAKLVFKLKTPVSPKPPGVCKKILNAKKLLTRNFRRWKRAGKPASKTHPIRKSYMSSRSDLQNMQRN